MAWGQAGSQRLKKAQSISICCQGLQQCQKECELSRQAKSVSPISTAVAILDDSFKPSELGFLASKLGIKYLVLELL